MSGPKADPRFAWSNPWVRVRRISVILGVLAIALFIAWTLLVPRSHPLAPIAIVSSLVLGACWLTGYLVSRRQELPTLGALVVRFAIIAVGVPAPIALAILMRLSRPTCTVLNILGLPWSTDARTVGIVVCTAIVIAALGAVIAGLIVAALRPLAIGLIVYGVCAFLFTIFALYFGDPAPGCVPI